jgi:quercetin dioxygenase-like cupin family protein
MRPATRLAFAAGLTLIAAPALADAIKPVVVTPLMTTSVTSSGQPIVLPQKDVQVIVSTYDIQPGATLPLHKHPSARYAYVLAGTLNVFNESTGETLTFKQGDFLLEAIGQWHRGSNVGADPVKLLVIDQIEKGNPIVIMKP